MCVFCVFLRLGDAQNLQETLKICYLGVPGTLKVQGQWGPLMTTGRRAVCTTIMEIDAGRLKPERTNEQQMT